jgi:hypothetical protein
LKKVDRNVDVLQLDVSGRPQAWISPREAAVIYASDGVAWTLGDPFHVLRGGIQRTTGIRSSPCADRCPPAPGARCRQSPT